MRRWTRTRALCGTMATANTTVASAYLRGTSRCPTFEVKPLREAAAPAAALPAQTTMLYYVSVFIYYALFFTFFNHCATRLS